MTKFRLISRFAGLSSVLTVFALWGCGTGPPDSRVDNSGSSSALDSDESGDEAAPDLLRPFATPTGRIQTFTLSGEIDTQNPFFQSLGTNGRRRESCHQAGD